MNFVEVTVGTQKHLLNVTNIDRLVPFGDGVSICLRDPVKGSASFVHVRETLEEMESLLDTAGATIHRLPD